ncbi:unnamed protein product [Calypogeia fissa]
MSAISSRNQGGLRKLQRIVNPFDSDEDEPTAPSTGYLPHVPNSSSSSSIRYTNPFDDDTVKPQGHTKSEIVAVDKHRVGKPWNPFDDDDSQAKMFNRVVKGNGIKSGHSKHSNFRHDVSNPFSDDYEVNSHPKTRGDIILDNGSLFDGEPSVAEPLKERKSSTRTFTTNIKKPVSRIEEGASSSFSRDKVPTVPSSSVAKGHCADKKTESKRIGKSQHSKELFGEPEPAYLRTQRNKVSQQDQRYFSTKNVEELEQLAVEKTQDTTSSIKNAIRIAEDTKGVATTTLKTLHHQGEQICRTHHTAVRVDEDLGRGEKLLGSLGGMFSMTWKPRKAHKICGPRVNTDQYKRKNHLGERDGLGLTGETPGARPQPQLSGTFSAQAQLVMQTKVQDEALTNLSHILNDLKGMTLEMGHEIHRQNGDLDRMHDDVDELNNRFKGAHNRSRHLLRR